MSQSNIWAPSEVPRVDFTTQMLDMPIWKENYNRGECDLIDLGPVDVYKHKAILSD